MKKNKPCLLKAGLFIIGILLLASCGIYDYPYIYPVPEGNIILRVTNTFVSINTGNDNADNPYFTHFIIFYRIYISDVDTPVTGSADTITMSRINNSMGSHHASINNISGSQSIGGAAAYDLITRSLRFRELALDNNNIDAILSNSAIGSIIEINFGHGTAPPYLSIGGANYTLIRQHLSTSSEERFFRNNIDGLMRDINNIDGDNRDVTNNTSTTKSHSHALMYIMAAGINTQNFAPIYSSPTFLGVLLLPD